MVTISRGRNDSDVDTGNVYAGCGDGVQVRV